MLRALDLPTPVSPSAAGDAPDPARSDAHILRRATLDDLDALVRLLADDAISADRGDVDDRDDRPAYRDALATIIASDANEVVVLSDAQGGIVATVQLTLVPGMTRRGSTRLIVESVRVARSARSAGIGTALIRWVAETATPALGADLIQLTSDAARIDAHRFYERLGFTGSHVGFKLEVSRRGAHSRDDADIP